MDHQPPRFKEFFYGTLFYNYLFIIFQLAYNYIFRDFLLEKSMGTVYGSGRSAVLGTVILLVIAAATYAVMIRFRLLRKGGARSAGAAAFIVWVLNWVIVVTMVLTAVKSFGIDISKHAEQLSDRENIIIICSIMGAMFQAGMVIALLARMAVAYEKTVSNLQRIMADVSAFIFLCVSYTVVWETIIYRTVATNGGYSICTGQGITGLTGAFFSFLLLYPPMRFYFLLQDIHDFRQGRGRLRMAIGYAAVILTVMIPLINTV